ncbi:MAG TPA: hypothetical protein PKA00_16740 [Saprospiraceae bacterium]|nr:hypothetical protein [Saprospiraceae bacterium]HMQ84565.1 hypothetical protein [Saprospiraceae bacterium]
MKTLLTSMALGPIAALLLVTSCRKQNSFTPLDFNTYDGHSFEASD